MADPAPPAATVVVANEQSAVEIHEAMVARLATEVLTALGVHGVSELSVVFVDAETIASLNARYRGRVGPTDVLSFAIDDVGDDASEHRPSTASGLPTLLGDVVICPEVARTNAPEHRGDRGHDGSVGDEVALLLIHGILHIRGWDHEADEDAERMEAEEAALLERYRALRGEVGAEVASER
ncbi:protein of unknown function UPF0054 [Acidimicrobium ferrooxidans DSM 10331]|uniref:Endoribonuclease YbeY n=1 Tax=Acidimicrobium ferrooxidans (strain DSM 10331 / JCM 15462 / NBRC 103882 / ICP) TaxID=525909 RepID=C7LZP3_ACIFD|nr:rRNA maturation RNase YbeY [Acidimicrobium ferrooxidans]ACU54201.1 protein of unknown function UPF0054 [Acidimicrobium ferrooxidans DSM 10331]